MEGIMELRNPVRTVVGALSLTVSHVAMAQTGAAPVAESAVTSQAPVAEANYGEILVTAQRRSERLQDVPISITAVTG